MVPTSTLEWHDRDTTMDNLVEKGSSEGKERIANPISMPALAFPNDDDAKYPDYSLETSITIQIWYPTNNAQASSSTFSKTPLLREVPQVKKRLSRKDRDSGSHQQQHPHHHYVSDSKSFPTFKNAAPNWLREKPSRQKLASQLVSASASLSLSSSPSSNLSSSPIPYAPEAKGTWKKALLVCRESGALIIYSDDRSLLHSISTVDLLASDIRFVDHSLFFCTNVLGIYSRPSTLHSGVRSPPPPLGRTSVQLNSNGNSESKGKGEPIYLCFPTNFSMKRWRALLRSFAKAEVYGHPYKGGTHRCYRQVEMTILEAKLNTERPIAPSRSDRHLGNPTSFENNEENEYSISGALGLMQVSEMPSMIKAEGASPIKESNDDIVAEKSPSTETTDPPEEAAPSVKSSDDDSDLELTSGPISGLSGKDRIAESSPRSIKLSLFGDSEKRPVIDNSANVVTSSYCLIWFAGDLVAQTKTCIGNSLNMTWFDKFSLKDLPFLQSLRIDVMQTGRNASRPTLLGSINLPLETMRRGEVIEGWFPIWFMRGSTRGDAEGGPLQDDPAFNHEMVGEIKLSLNVIEETILPLKKYAAIEEALDSVDCISLIETLCKRLEEDRVIAYLVEIYASKGNIAERLNELIEIESHSFGENAALLFRGNTILTRAIDKYQRMFCRDWLDACIGTTVRRICRDRIHLESNDERHYYHVPPFDDEKGKIHVTAESNLDALKRICRELWTSIFANRHQCPKDLQSTLYKVRTKVNTLPFRPSESNHPLGPGIQGVGAFVFLRLICPAITSPNLYGLMGAAPSAACSKTLMLVAKVFLALANKKIGFDKDKESWLVQANDFLIEQALAYDEFITTVSTEPESGQGNEKKRVPLGDEDDYELQDKVNKMVDRFPILPRESIPSQEYLLDRPLALASLISYVVREASVDSYLYNDKGITNPSRNDSADAQYRQDKYEEFVELCCDVEDKVGYYIDKAGYKPNPIYFTKLQATTSALHNKRSRSTQVYAANTPNRASIPIHDSLSSSGNKDGKQESTKIRRATVSDLQTVHIVNVKQQQQQISSNATSVGIPRMRRVGEDSVLKTLTPSRLISSTINPTRVSPDDSVSDDRVAPFQSSQNHLENSGVEARMRHSSGNWADQARIKSSTIGFISGEKSIGEDPASSISSKQRWWKK